MEQNFMKKLGEKWADFKFGNGKMTRKVAALILAGAMAVPMLFSASACEFVVHKNPNGQIVVTPGDDTGKTPGGNQETPGNQQGTQSGGEDKTEPDYSIYSDILQTVLTSEYYNDLAKKAANSELDHYVDGKAPADLGKNLIEAIPYRFLQNEGADIENIQLDRIYVDTLSYTTNEKELYLKVNIKQPNQANPYITQYLLKYDINEKEYNDLTTLNKNNYIQAGFFIQELDNQREPKFVSKFNIYEDSYKSLLECLPSSKKLLSAFGNNKIDNFTVTNCTLDKKNYVLDLIVMNKSNSSKSLYDSKIATMKLVVYDDAIPSYNNNIFALESPIYLFDKEVGEVQSITCFKAYPNIIWNKNLIEKN